MNREQIRFLIAAAKDTRLETPIAVAAVTGLRRGELLALRWQHVDLDKGTLFVAESLEHSRAASGRIRFKGPKSKTSRRVIPLAPECVMLLRSHKAQQEEEKALPAGRTLTTISSSQTLTVALGLPTHSQCSSAKLAQSVGMRGFRFHDLRHAFASLTLGRRCVDQGGADAHGAQLAGRDAFRLCAFDRRPRAAGRQRARSFAPGSGEGLSLR